MNDNQQPTQDTQDDTAKQPAVQVIQAGGIIATSMAQPQVQGAAEIASKIQELADHAHEQSQLPISDVHQSFWQELHDYLSKVLWKVKQRA